MDVQAQNCNGEQSVLRIHHLKQGGSEKVHEEAVNIDKGFYENNYSVILDANESGVQHYRVSVANVADEVTTANM